MIDYFALALTHALIVIALLRLLVRDDLDREGECAEEAAADLPRSQRKTRRARRRSPENGDA